MDSEWYNTPEMKAKWEAEDARLRASAAAVIDDLVDEFNHGVDQFDALRRTILQLSERYGRCVEIPDIQGSAVAWEPEPPRSAMIAAAQARLAREYADIDALENAYHFDTAAASDDVRAGARIEC